MTVVVGLGNPLRQDEGIGVRILKELEERLAGRQRDVRLMDIGTSGLRIFDAFEGAQSAIIIDCAFMDQQPGTMLRFTPDEVQSRRNRLSTSPHAGDLLAIVDLARSLGPCPEEIVLFGIEPLALGYAEDLSPVLAERLPLYCERILEELDRLAP